MSMSLAPFLAPLCIMTHTICTTMLNSAHTKRAKKKEKTKRNENMHTGASETFAQQFVFIHSRTPIVVTLCFTRSFLSNQKDEKVGPLFSTNVFSCSFSYCFLFVYTFGLFKFIYISVVFFFIFQFCTRFHLVYVLVTMCSDLYIQLRNLYNSWYFATCEQYELSHKKGSWQTLRH